VRLELDPSVVGYTDGHTEPFIMLTVYNRGRPQKVETVSLRMSNGRYLQLPIPDKPFKPLPKVVTETEKYVVGFQLEDVRRHLKTESEPGHQVRITGAMIAWHQDERSSPASASTLTTTRSTEVGRLGKQE